MSQDILGKFLKHIFVDEFLYPILASERFRTFDRDCALAFMVQHQGKTFLLDERCEKADEIALQGTE